MIFVCGLDLGQMRDPSAFIVLEASGTQRRLQYEMLDPELKLPYTAEKIVETMPLYRADVRHIERFPLGTKYSDIANMVYQRILKIPQPSFLAVDQTGVGRAAMEMMSGMNPIGITFTAGGTITRVSPEVQDYHVPKRDLVSNAQVLLQNRILRIARGLPHTDLLVKELEAFRVKVSQAGHDSYEAWREKDHDDLVLALAISIWTAELVISINAYNEMKDMGLPPEPPIISLY